MEVYVLWDLVELCECQLVVIKAAVVNGRGIASSCESIV